jgi:hypothetical protein
VKFVSRVRSRTTGEGYIACTGSTVHAQVHFLSFCFRFFLSFPFEFISPVFPSFPFPCFSGFFLLFYFFRFFFLPPFYTFVTCFFIYVYCFSFALILSPFCLYILFLSSLLYLFNSFCVFPPLSFIHSFIPYIFFYFPSFSPFIFCSSFFHIPFLLPFSFVFIPFTSGSSDDAIFKYYRDQLHGLLSQYQAVSEYNTFPCFLFFSVRGKYCSLLHYATNVST